MESICVSQPAGNARLCCGHKERQTLRFDSKSSGTKLPAHITLIFSADIRWKAFAATKTVTPFVESVKNTQLSEADLFRWNHRRTEAGKQFPPCSRRHSRNTEALPHRKRSRPNRCKQTPVCLCRIRICRWQTRREAQRPR